MNHIFKSKYYPKNVYDICVLSVARYSLATMTLKIRSINKLLVLQRAMESAMLDINLRNIKNEEIWRRTKVVDVVHHVADL